MCAENVKIMEKILLLRAVHFNDESMVFIELDSKSQALVGCVSVA